MICLFVLTALLAVATAPSSVPTATAPALEAYATAWSQIDRYRATLEMHELSGNDVQDRTYAFDFTKPNTATIAITKGPGHGGHVTWSGGDDVVATPPGLLGGFHIRLSMNDGRVTSLRGDTVEMASFGWVLEHFRKTPGVETERPGAVVDGDATTEISLAIAQPSTDKGITRETILLSNHTSLPLEVERYVGAQLVKTIHYRNVIVGAH